MACVLRFLLVLSLFYKAAAQNCTSISSALNGTWTSTNLGTVTISSSALTLTMTKVFRATMTSSYFTCLYRSGSQYVFKMNQTITVTGLNVAVNVYGCFDFTQSSTYAFYYYHLAEKEVILSDERFVVKLTTYKPSFDEVCNVSVGLDPAEFHTMIKKGYEDAAISALRCPDPTLGLFRYTYTDQAGTFCSNVNTSSIKNCNSSLNYGEFIVNNTGCTTKSPFYSSAGSVGCVVSLYSSSRDTYYVSYYNRDNPFTQVVGGVTYYRFTCVAIQQTANGTVYLSLMPTDCVAAQSALALPSLTSTAGVTTTGAKMVLKPICIPPTTSKTENHIWLYVFLIPVGVLALVIIVVICLHCKCKEMEKKKAREKQILISDDHPLGEMSIALDAPASMERIPNGYIDVHDDLFAAPKSIRKRGDNMTNPMGETSMSLSFRRPSWAGFTPRKSISSVPMDPFSEMDSGIVLPMSQEGSKTPKSQRSPTKQKSFLYNDGAQTRKASTNGDVNAPLAITDGRFPYPISGSPDAMEIRSVRREKSFSRDAFVRSQTVYAPSDIAPSSRAKSVRAQSVRAPSVRAPSVKAPSVAARSTHSNHSRKALSVVSSKASKTIPRMVRSVTSTKIGSVTRKSPGSPKKKKKLSRSKTMVLPTEAANDKAESGMTDFMNAEMQDWGARSETGKSRRSTRTNKSKSTTTPRKSILKRNSKYMSTEEFLTEEEISNQFMSPGNPALAEGSAPPTNPTLPGSSAPLNGSAGRSLQDEYNDMIDTLNPKSSFKKVKSSRKPWH